MRYLCVSDIHGHYKELKEALDKSNFDVDKDHLVVLGDLFDRGSESDKVFEYLYELTNKGCATVVKGNHELFIEEVFDLNEKRMLFNIEHNGFQFTLNSLSKTDVTGFPVEKVRDLIMKNYPNLIDWIRELPVCFETEKYIGVHAGFDPTLDWKQMEQKKLLWTKTREFRELDLTLHGVSKTVIHGHVSCRNLRDYDGEYGNDFSIYKSLDGQKIGIDGYVMKTGRINVYIFEEKSV